MKFTIGAKVRVVSNLSNIKDFSGGFMEDMTQFENKIVTVRNVYHNGISIKEDDNLYTWDFRCFVPVFEKGDIVEINTDCTIKDLNANDSNGCRNDTFSFIRESEYLPYKDFKIDFVTYFGNCKIGEYLVNPICLKLVENKKPKEMTVAEISKALGYDVKIIK